MHGDGVFEVGNTERSVSQFVDNRPEAIAQRKLQEVANNSPQVSQLRALQAMANKAMKSSNTPIQRVKPGSKPEAQALTTGTVKKVKNVGDRHGGKHGGRELKQQLIAAGESADSVNALTFKEYDVNGYNGTGRDAERIVEASDGRIFYTGQHYAVGSFEEIT